MQITGTIKLINEQTTHGANNFRKREFVITTDEQYPQDVKLELQQDKCDLINNYQVGQRITVDFNIRGNEWQGKYYVNLQAWKITSEQAAHTIPVPQTSPTYTHPTQVGLPPEQAPTIQTKQDDLPF